MKLIGIIKSPRKKIRCLKIRNKVVLITGSNRGIGKSLALVFAINNFNVIIHGRDKKKLSIVKKEVEKNKVKCISVAANLTSDNDLDKLAKIAMDHDIDVLINNAGLLCPHLPLEKVNDKQIDEIIQTNLISPIKLTRRLYPFFIRRKSGVIININSLSGRENHYLRTLYGSSKWGLRGFTDSLRKEAKDHNISVCGVYLGSTKTKSYVKVGMEPKYVANMIFDHCIKFEEPDLILDSRPKNKKLKNTC